MNPKSSADTKQDSPLLCPKCGAPACLPDDLTELMVHCDYCDERFPVPRTYREAQERRLFQLRWPPQRSSTVGLATVIGFVVLVGGAFAGTVTGIFAKRRDPPPVIVTDNAPTQKIAAPVTEPSPELSTVDGDLSSGESIVRKRLAEHANAGCNNTLLLPTHIVGERDIDAKFVAGGPCVRFIAATGTVGEPLVLIMRAPGGKIAATPAPSTEIDFLYCPSVAGAHPATIRGADGDTFTVSSVECPRK